MELKNITHVTTLPTTPFQTKSSSSDIKIWSFVFKARIQTEKYYQNILP